MSGIKKQESRFEDTPLGWGQHWKMEIDWARKSLKDFHEAGDEAIRRFKDDRSVQKENTHSTRLNIYTQNIKALEAHLFGQMPKVQASRRYADAGDDAARVAAEMLERLLNTDIEDDADSFQEAIGNSVKDFTRAGLGAIRLRYVVEGEPVLDQAGQPTIGEDGQPLEQRAYECAESSYIHWKNLLWSPCKVWADVRWVAEKLYFTRQGLKDEFGEEIGNAVPLNADPSKTDDAEKENPWARAEVWEIWDKETEKVFWVSESYPTPLRTQDDPLKLDRFFPFPRPMMSNLTTDQLIPIPEYKLAKDLYDEIDLISTRITALERAVRVVGVYDGANEELKRLLEDTCQNKMIPVENFAALAEKNGIRGSVDWFPLEMVVTALDKLRDYRAELLQLADQMTGTSDMMRGQSDGQGTAREAVIKQANANIRIRAMEEELARFATDAQRIKREIIAKHYAPETLIQKSNMMSSADRVLVPQAVQLLQSQWADYRVEVKPEAINQLDFASLRSERAEFIQGLSAYLQAAAPLAQAMPGSTPFLLELAQWAVAGFRGSSTAEGIFDRAIQQAQQQPPPGQDKPDPKVEAQKMKTQGELMKVQAESQADLARIAAETQAEGQKQSAQTFWNIMEEREKAKLKLQGEIARGSLPQGAEQ